jgi:hypothetical protein
VAQFPVRLLRPEDCQGKVHPEQQEGGFRFVPGESLFFIEIVWTRVFLYFFDDFGIGFWWILEIWKGKKITMTMGGIFKWLLWFDAQTKTKTSNPFNVLCCKLKNIH